VPAFCAEVLIMIYVSAVTISRGILVAIKNCATPTRTEEGRTDEDLKQSERQSRLDPSLGARRTDTGTAHLVYDSRLHLGNTVGSELPGS
jgi:hypothetical protein